MAPNDEGRHPRQGPALSKKISSARRSDDHCNTGPDVAEGGLFDARLNPDLAAVRERQEVRDRINGPTKNATVLVGKRRRVTQTERAWQILLSGVELTGLSAARDYGILNMASRASEILKQGKPLCKRQVLVDRPGGGVARETLYFVAPEHRPASAP